MKMRKALRGTRSVFSFTLRQFFRNKSNLLSLLLFFTMALVSMPLTTYLQGGQVAADTPVAPAAVVLQNGTGLPLREALAAEEFWRHTDFAAREADITATVTADANGYTVAVTGSGEEAVMEALEWDIHLALTALHPASLGLTAEQLAVVNSPFETVIPAQAAGDTPAEEVWIEVDGEEGMASFWVQYGYAIVVMMLCLLSSGYIIRTVVEEKDSKLIELLLLSVEPLALLVGKILATMVYTVAMLLCALMGYGASLGLTAALFGRESIDGIVETLSTLLPDFAADPRQALGLLAAIVVSLGLAFLTMSLLGGLSGACCSTVEEAGSASMTVTLLTMAGYLGSCVTAAFQAPAVALFSSLCPILSVFCAPVRFAQGDISVAVLCLSWALQILVIGLLALFTARVYRELVIHRGSRITWRQLLQLRRKEATV